MEQKRILWIDGLRGMACLCIVLHHFVMGYVPGAYSGDVGVAHLSNGMERAFAQSPLSFFTIGDFWVTIFCMVSGFVIANQVYRMTSEEQLSKALFKRYPRLMLPVAAVSVLVFFMMQVGLFYNDVAAAQTGSEWLAMFYNEKASLRELFFGTVADTWFVGMQLTFSNAFWMLNELFIGSFVAYILAVIGKKQQTRMLYLYGFFTLVFLSMNSRYAAFSIGVALALVFAKWAELWLSKKGSALIGVALMVVAVLLGAYPVGMVPTNAYRLLILPESSPMGSYYFYHILGAACLMLGIGLCKPLIKALSLAPLQLLGKISYSVFLVHIPILFSLSAWIFVTVLSSGVGYSMAAGMTLLTSVAAVLLIGWLFYRFVEMPCQNLVHKLTQFFFEEAGREE